ncbi:glypican-5-like [Mya arenaria]|uniref:glypican-5-like n=1 Tax=Mya arenaria TaxID=6604 RepID=UPI0022E65134|nr:glypican-5-like [Mya arenaria]
MGRSGMFSLFIFCLCFGLIKTHNSDLKCDTVKEEFSKISKDNLVPDLPTIDEGLRVCSRSLTSQQATCCSQDSELAYLRASESYLLNNVRARNSFLKIKLTTHLADYQGKVLALVHHTLNSTSAKLTEWYGIPPEEHKPIVHSLFSTVEQYISLKNVIVQDSVYTFFDHIFPVIFKNVIYQSSQTWTHHNSHCLTTHRQAIKPQPFGQYPEEISTSLSSGLALARAYLEALNIILETVNTTDNILIEDECKHALVRLQYCSHCRGFVSVKPCNGFCLDVMRGCLSNMAEIGYEWNNIITSVEGLVREMSEKSLDEVFKRLSVGITDALFNAVTSSSNYYENVAELCSITTATTGGARPEPKTPDISRSSVSHVEVMGPLSMDVMKVTLDLVDSKGLYSNLADDICAEPAKFEQDPLSGTCWNGTEVSVYVRSPVDVDILEQARNNPEVKVSLVLHPDLRNLKDKLSTVNQVLQSHTHKSERSRYRSSMISDDPIVLHMSGDGRPIGNVNIQGGTTLFDDEDLTNYISGSGSGQDEPIDTVVDTGGSQKIDVVLEDNNGFNGGGEPSYEVNQGGKLGQPPRSTPRPNSNKQTPRSAAPPCGVPSTFTMLLAILLYTLLTQR